MRALDMTGGDLMRALARVAERPAVDAALRERAEEVADAIAARADAAGIGEATVVRVLRPEAGTYAVAVAAPGLFAREFGALDMAAEPLIGGAIAEATEG